jgi:hypothetical protein
VVSRKITARYWARFDAVKAAASSVASTAKLFAVPSSRIAWMPLGMDECRKPAVFEKTSTL